MKKFTRLIIVLITVAVSFSGWFLLPSIQWYYFVPAADKEFLNLSQDQLDTQPAEIKKKITKLKQIRSRTISLGLDLQGGVNLTLQVDDKDLKKKLLEKYDFDQAKADAAFGLESTTASGRALEVLKNRMDSFGVAEVSIRPMPDGRISVELPGVNNPQLVREMLSKVGRLEFRIVDEATMLKLQQVGVSMVKGYVVSAADVPTGYEMQVADTNGNIVKPQGNLIPEDSEWISYWENDEFGMPKMMGWYVLKKKVELDGTMVKNARQDADQYGNYKIDFELTDDGADIFAEATANNVKKRLAIVLDGKVKSAPNINEEISGGNGQITGSYTLDEAVLLANILKAGALPVKLDIVQERVIGPSLGKDSINQAGSALVFGMIAVVIFMVIYYRGAGLISIVALVFNLLYLFAMLGAFKATMTLSGIAGIALTVGMAVDANVIIYERIREEMRRSRNIKHAVNSGFEHASATIWDSNLTTLMASLALAFFGKGSIQGFGVNLTLGIIANMFAALFISKLIFDWWLDTFNPKKLSI